MVGAAKGYRLDTCVWEITLACNFRCAHCGSAAGGARKDELTREEALAVADQLADLGCRRVILIGGEVFFRPDWVDIARRLADRGVQPGVITNGWLLRDERAWDDVMRSGVRQIGVSIDGYREDHDRMRMPGSFDAACEALDQIKAHGLASSAITVVNSGNIEGLESLRKELEARKVDSWQVQLCSPFGNAGHSKGLVPTREQISQVVSYAAGLTVEGALPRIFLADNIGYHSELEGLVRGRVGGCFPGCAAGLSVIGIDSVGNVRGCESLYDDRFIEGNLRQRSLRDIWEDPEAFSYNRGFKPEDLHGMCAGCEMGPNCAGGCRSLNHFYSGDMFESRTCIREM